MPNSIYQQMGQALAQAVKYGERTILYRGLTISCAVMIGDTMTRLGQGGLQDQQVIHVKIPRVLPDPVQNAALQVLIGQEGEPHTNEQIQFPAFPQHGLIPRNLMIHEVIADEYNWSCTLLDPSQ